jgi:hypothetical protein
MFLSREVVHNVLRERLVVQSVEPMARDGVNRLLARTPSQHAQSHRHHDPATVLARFTGDQDVTACQHVFDDELGGGSPGVDEASQSMGTSIVITWGFDDDEAGVVLCLLPRSGAED